MWFDRGKIPIFFEALPTEAGATEERQSKHAEMLAPLARLDVDAINVPEIIGGKFDTIDNRAFASRVQSVTGLPTIVNHISVQHSLPKFHSWVADARKASLEHFVFVGGESSKATDPGPSVTAALSAAEIPGTKGCITIPTRRRAEFDEPERLFRKQQAGADYAISQILGESVTAAQLQHDAAAYAWEHDSTCLPLMWSLSPICRLKDIEFLKWLGVEFPARYESRLRGASDSQDRLKVSHDTNVSMARNLLENAEHEDNGPIGFCIEHVMQSNMAPAFDLVERIRDVSREFKSRQLAPPIY